ncbi:MAG: D-glycero-alpha-D-manno-heptose-1,7-bisphosphate 7-phosphatase [Actinomycetota bacterium]|nr:HAD family hydrolase [Actinomycetota bacterium]
MAGAIFVDRDGVICENRDDYVKSWEEFRFIPGAAEALAALTTSGLRLFVVTNQSAISRGIVTRDAIDDMHARMLDVLRAAGARVEAVLVCPHSPEDSCACRKPSEGLLLDAAKQYGVELAESWMIGDAESDVVAGKRAGCETVLVLTGRGATQARSARWLDGKPDLVAHDLVDAAIWVLARVAERTRAMMEVIRP